MMLLQTAYLKCLASACKQNKNNYYILKLYKDWLVVFLQNVQSILLYAAETWTLLSVDARAPEAFHMNNNNNDDIYSAVIVAAQPLREFTRFRWPPTFGPSQPALAASPPKTAAANQMAPVCP